MNSPYNRNNPYLCLTIGFAMHVGFLIEQRDGKFTCRLSKVNGEETVTIETASTSAFEATSITVTESGTVTTKGDAGGFNDFFGHARGGQTEQNVSFDRLAKCLYEFMCSWVKLPTMTRVN